VAVSTAATARAFSDTPEHKPFQAPHHTKGNKVTTKAKITIIVGSRLGVTLPARLRACKGGGASAAILAPVCVLVAALALAVGATPAFANSVHLFSHTIGTGTRGEGAGELELTAPMRECYSYNCRFTAFAVPGSGVAVNNETHDVYVADTGNNRVDEFEADGTFIRAFGKEVNKTKVNTPGATEAEKNVCNGGGLEECQKGAFGSVPSALEAPAFVAVDNDSSSGSHGDVYVGTGVGRDPSDEEQIITFADVTGGAYKLTFEGQTTKEIASEAGAKQIQAALEELSTVGTGNVYVTNGSVTLGHYQETSLYGMRVLFIGALKDKSLPLLTCGASSLAPPGATCEVTMVENGQRFVPEVIAKFGSAGALEEGWGVNGQLDGSTASEGPFGGELDGIAVDTSGDLWALTSDFGQGGGPGEVYEFGQEGAFKENFGRRESSLGGIAVGAPGEIYYARTLYPPVGQEVQTTGVALDTAGKELYEDFGEFFGSSIKSAQEAFTSPGLEKGGGAGLAVDSSVGTAVSSGAVYAADAATDMVEAFDVGLEVETDGASEVTAATATLNGTVDPKGSPVSECYFEYGETIEYGQRVECEGLAGIGSGASEVSVHAKLTKLRGGTAYHFHLVARNGNGSLEGEDKELGTLTTPVVTGGEAVDVTESGAELRASVNPEGLQVTHCVFEYGTSSAYGQVAKCAQTLAEVGAGSGPIAVSAQLAGLEANTTYYWRLSAKDVNGEAFESGHTFVYPTAGAVLPDHRAYEMVTPPFKNGASLGVAFTGDFSDIAESGSRVIAVTIQCFGEARSCTGYRADNGEPFEFTRTAQGWVTGALAPPATQFGENSTWLVGAQEGVALFSMPTGPGGEEEWYARTAGGLSVIGPATPPGSTQQIAPIYHTGHAATADLSHLVFETEEPGSAGVVNQAGGGFWPYDQTSRVQGAKSLYEYVGTGNRQPLLVGVEGGEGSTKLIADCGVQLGGGNNGVNAVRANALSSDGRTVFFTVCPGSQSELYARVDGEEPSAHTVMVSASECAEGQPGAAECKAVSGERRVARFEGASTDGSRAYFLSTQKLTDEATQGTGSAAEGGCSEGSANACNLYEYDFARPENERLVDVSAAENAALVPDGPRVQGVLASSADGSHVYFVAKGVLSTVSNAEGQRAVSGRENLYVYGEGHLAFITVLPLNDVEVDLSNRVANVTPDGRFLVFEDSGQVYRYDADPTPGEEAAHVPALVRVTVGQDGYNDNGDGAVGQAIIVPVYLTGGDVGSERADPTMSNDGSRVFFMSPVGLTPHALNDVQVGVYEPFPGQRIAEYAQNVYEWEQEGHGSCQAGQSAGCVYLVSDGHDVSEAPTKCAGFLNSGDSAHSGTCLLGTDATGDDAFFSTTDRLAPKDTDTQEDIYDARVCEPEAGNPCITEPPPPLPPCDGESCHGIPEATPSLLAPGTASFNGEGNMVGVSSAASPPKKVAKKAVKCRKGFVKNKKSKCVRARSKKPKKKAVKANRRTGR
jgi:hypothetical protein